MKHTELSWQSADDLKIYGQEWRPDRDPVAVVVLVHGMGEHSGRYAHVAEHLIKKGLRYLHLITADMENRKAREAIRLSTIPYWTISKKELERPKSISPENQSSCMAKVWARMLL